VVSNNIDRDNMTAAPYASSTPDIDSASDWYLTGSAASAAIDSGFPVRSIVHLDFEQKLRPVDDPTWNIDIGAMESDASAPDTPPANQEELGQAGQPYCVKPDGSRCD
jgi:hypothetical protein